MTQDEFFEAPAEDGYWERVAATALTAARACMEPYGSRFSRQDFTRRQRPVILVLRQLQKTTYRGVCAFLHSTPGVRAASGLSRVPHFTTAQESADRADVLAVAGAMLGEIAGHMVDGPVEMATDATGMEVTCGASRSSASERSCRESRSVKASPAVLGGLCIPCALVVDWGPGSDLTPALIDKAMAVLAPTRADPDRGSDSERLHEQLRHEHGVKSVIPPVPRRPRQVVRTTSRSMMQEGPPGRSGRRWHAETAISGIKHLTGSTSHSRAARSSRPHAKSSAYTVHCQRS